MNRLPPFSLARTGQFEATFWPGLSQVKGSVHYELANGSGKREYLFEVSFCDERREPHRIGQIKHEIISVADSNKGKSLSDRDGLGRPIRDAIGLPKNARPDLRDYVRRIAFHVREQALLSYANKHQEDAVSAGLKTID